MNWQLLKKARNDSNIFKLTFANKVAVSFSSMSWAPQSLYKSVFLIVLILIFNSAKLNTNYRETHCRPDNQSCYREDGKQRSYETIFSRRNNFFTLFSSTMSRCLLLLLTVGVTGLRFPSHLKRHGEAWPIRSRLFPRLPNQQSALVPRQWRNSSMPVNGGC